MTFEDAIIAALELAKHEPRTKPTARAVERLIPQVAPEHSWGWLKIQLKMYEMVQSGILRHHPPRNGYEYIGKKPIKIHHIDYCPTCGQPRYDQLKLPLNFAS